MHENERARYRETLVELRNRLTGEVRKAMSKVANQAAAPDELSHVPTHAADRDSEGLDRDIALEATREQMLEAIDRALARIDEGSYGRCEDCGGEIPRVRLDALPFAARCIACEERQERG